MVPEPDRSLLGLFGFWLLIGLLVLFAGVVFVRFAFFGLHQKVTKFFFVLSHTRF